MFPEPRAKARGVVMARRLFTLVLDSDDLEISRRYIVQGRARTEIENRTESERETLAGKVLAAARKRGALLPQSLIDDLTL